MDERPSAPRLRAIRGSRFGEPSRRPKTPDVFAKDDAPAKSATKTKRPKKAQVVEPPGALLHLALAKGNHHREWFIGILGKEWTYTAIYEIDGMPHIYAPLMLDEARIWVRDYLQLVEQSRKEGYADAPLKHCGWSGLTDPGERIVPTEAAG